MNNGSNATPRISISRKPLIETKVSRFAIRAPDERVRAERGGVPRPGDPAEAGFERKHWLCGDICAGGSLLIDGFRPDLRLLRGFGRNARTEGLSSRDWFIASHRLLRQPEAFPG